VLQLIPHGSEHPVTATSMAKILNIPLRDVYSCIQILIMDKNIPIGGLRSGSNPGYFIITNELERALVITPLEHHIGAMSKHLSHLKQMDL
jgi:hypothetical protein